MSEFRTYTLEELNRMTSQQINDAWRRLEEEIKNTRTFVPPVVSIVDAAVRGYSFLIIQRAIILAKAKEGIEEAAKHFMDTTL